MTTKKTTKKTDRPKPKNKQLGTGLRIGKSKPEKANNQQNNRVK